jgi:hypothetical protein
MEETMLITNKSKNTIYIGTNYIGTKPSPTHLKLEPGCLLELRSNVDITSLELVDINLVKEILAADNLANYLLSPNKVERELAELVATRDMYTW